MPKSNSSTVPRTTHTWLKNLYDYIDGTAKLFTASGASGIPNAVAVGLNQPLTRVGNSTGIVAFYGNSGLPLFTGYGLGFGTSGGTNAWSGSSGILATGIGASGLLSAIQQIGFNGGTGTVVSLNDIVRTLKNAGLLPQ